MASVLLAIHDCLRRRALHEALAAERHRVEVTATLSDALAVVARRHVDVAFVDPCLDLDGALRRAIRRHGTTPRTLLVRLAGVEAGAVRTCRPDATFRADADAAAAAALVDRLLPRIAG